MNSFRARPALLTCPRYRLPEASADARRTRTRVGSSQLAGSVFRHDEATCFHSAAVNRSHWSEDAGQQAGVASPWRVQPGDRYQDQVFIGICMQVGARRRSLGACLLPMAAMQGGHCGWATLPAFSPARREG